MTKRLLIASPAKGGLPPFYMELFEDMIREGVPGWEVEFVAEGNQNALNIARNILANTAIAQGFDRMLMLDTDEPATKAHISRILSHDHDKYPIVSGLYCMKRPGTPFWLGIRTKGAAPDEQGLLAADFVPTGFLSVSTAAMRQMGECHKDRAFYAQDDVLSPAPRKEGPVIAELFPIGVCGPRTPAARLRRVREAMKDVLEKGPGGVPRATIINTLNNVVTALTEEKPPGYLCGEDYHFSVLAKQAGVGMWLDTRCVVPHRGAIDYPITDPSVVATSCNQIPEHEGDVTTW